MRQKLHVMRCNLFVVLQVSFRSDSVGERIPFFLSLINNFESTLRIRFRRTKSIWSEANDNSPASCKNERQIISLSARQGITRIGLFGS